MLHFHKWEEIARERVEITMCQFGHSYNVLGLKTLEMCSKCETLRGFIYDSNGSRAWKLVDVLFDESEIDEAVRKYNDSK